MTVAKTFALAAGGAVVTAIGVLAATAPHETMGVEPGCAPEPDDEPAYDEAAGFRHEDTLTRLTVLIPA
jgi:hypothetical protein